MTIYLVALTALMVAGSFIGAEYSTGSIANWLSFIPRRGRVFASKLVTIVAFSALASAAAAALDARIAALVLARLYDIPVGEAGRPSWACSAAACWSQWRWPCSGSASA